MRVFAFIFCLLPLITYAQTSTNDAENDMSFLDRIFLPALELGYVVENSDALNNGIMIKTSVEYRTKSNVFAKLNFDAIGLKYELENLDGFTNVVKGRTTIEDLVLGVGYRFGKEEFRTYLLYQGGIRFYDYPNATQIGNTITIDQNLNTTTIHRFSIGTEYYFDSKTAITAEFSMARVGQEVDFWVSNQASLGMAIGFTTSIL